MKGQLQRMVETYPSVLRTVRGLGFLVGLELHEREKIPAFANADKASSIQFVNKLHEAGVLTIPSGAQVIRLLPALNLSRRHAEEGLSIIEQVVKKIA